MSLPFYQSPSIFIFLENFISLEKMYRQSSIYNYRFCNVPYPYSIPTGNIAYFREYFMRGKHIRYTASTHYVLELCRGKEAIRFVLQPKGAFMELLPPKEEITGESWILYISESILCMASIFVMQRPHTMF